MQILACVMYSLNYLWIYSLTCYFICFWRAWIGDIYSERDVLDFLDIRLTKMRKNLSYFDVPLFGQVFLHFSWLHFPSSLLVGSIHWLFPLALEVNHYLCLSERIHTVTQSRIQKYFKIPTKLLTISIINHWNDENQCKKFNLFHLLISRIFCYVLRAVDKRRIKVVLPKICKIAKMLQ